jgi:lysozyme
MHKHYLDSIKASEGFTARAQFDYAQYSNGYGTKALHPGERIDRAEAERRFAAEIAEARAFVDKAAGGWDEGTKAALTSLTFNAGTRWASSGLGEAVRNGDIDGVRSRFLQYTKAGGKDLAGLVTRRLDEVTWIGQAETATGRSVVGTPALASAEPADATVPAARQTREPDRVTSSIASTEPSAVTAAAREIALAMLREDIALSLLQMRTRATDPA